MLFTSVIISPTNIPEVSAPYPGCNAPTFTIVSMPSLSITNPEPRV